MKTLYEHLIKQHINKTDNSLENSKEITDIFNKYCKRYANTKMQDNFVTLVLDELVNNKNAMFANKQVLLEEWPNVDDVANELYYELEDSADKNDFYYETFYAVKDAIVSNKEVVMSKIIYIILKNNLK